MKQGAGKTGRAWAEYLGGTRYRLTWPCGHTRTVDQKEEPFPKNTVGPEGVARMANYWRKENGGVDAGACPTCARVKNVEPTWAEFVAWVKRCTAPVVLKLEPRGDGGRMAPLDMLAYSDNCPRHDEQGRPLGAAGRSSAILVRRFQGRDRKRAELELERFSLVAAKYGPAPEPEAAAE
jgi:hypothetical protein